MLMNKFEILKNKIKYRSSYRGLKEMDILLSTFAASIVNCLNSEELEDLIFFLECSDEDIYNFYMYGKKIPNFTKIKILNLFKNFKIKTT
jgi:succinate dehydrogenase flavin-adding protein (antitoxin of CptAB toxin-antitoxin module)